MFKFLLGGDRGLLTIFRVSKMRKWLISEASDCADIDEITPTNDVYVRLFSELVKNSYGLEGLSVDESSIFSSCDAYIKSERELFKDSSSSEELAICQSMYQRMMSTLIFPLHASVICDILLASDNDKEDFIKVKSSIYSILCDYSIKFNRLQRVVYAGRLNDEFLRIFAELYLRLADTLLVFDCYICACNAILFRECLYYGISPIILHCENEVEYNKILEDKSDDRVAKLVDLFKKEQKATAKFLKSL